MADRAPWNQPWPWTPADLEGALAELAQRAPFLPGRTVRPGAIPWPADAPGGSHSPDLSEERAWLKSPAYLAGWRCYDAGRFWEAHEAWEDCWHAARQANLDQQAARLRALIQLAACGLKLRLGQTRAARTLWQRAERNAAQASDQHTMGVDLAKHLEAWRRILDTESPDWRARRRFKTARSQSTE